MSDGFKLVTYKKSRRRKIAPRDFAQKIILKDSFTNKEQKYIQKKISRTRSEVVKSAYYTEFQKQLKLCLESLQASHIEEIICLGLGNFSTSLASCHQLGLLLNLKEQYSSKLLLHDPLFNEFEIEVLNQYNCDVIIENEEGKHLLSDNKINFVYLPHCPVQLVENFLWKNWSSVLQNCLIVNSSFTEIISFYRDSIEFIHHITCLQPYTNEISIENNYEFDNIFNNLSVHTFHKLKHLEVGNSFWNCKKEPIYSDLELVTKNTLAKLII